MEFHGERRRILAITIVFIVSSGIATLGTAQDGFLSIDCGGNRTHYTDNVTGLHWINDYRYFRNDLAGMVPFPVAASVTNHAALQSFRYFSRAETKYCYRLPLTETRSSSDKNTSVLIRAMFLHGGSSVLVLPISFDIYVNGSLWTSVDYTLSESFNKLHKPQEFEGTFPLVGNTINICLVPRQGTPFISSLELRELDADGIMYSFENILDRQDIFLSKIIRWTVGICVPESIIRYPDDEYDRIWLCPKFDTGEITGAGAILVLVNESLAIAGSARENYVPGSVMASGVVSSERNEFRFTVGLPLEDSASIYAVLYFLDLNSSDDGWLLMSCSFQRETSPNINVSRDFVTSRTYEQSTASSNVVSMAFVSDAPGKAVINGFEIYERKVLNYYSTQIDNVELIDLLQRDFNLSGDGDPCIPEPHDWILCTPTQNLSVWVDDGDLETTSNSYVTYLESITLSHLKNVTKLSGLSYEKYFSLVLLISVSIIHSELDDETFQFFTKNVISIDDHAWITTLDVTDNSISTFPSNMSYGMPAIRFLNFSRNLFSGTIPSSLDDRELDVYFSTNVMHLSNNKFTGEFPADMFFSANSSLTFLDLAQNELGEVLDLSGWRNKLDRSNVGVQILLSLVNNSISNIRPNAEILTSIVPELLNGSSFNKSATILLGGNPYCKGASSFEQLYICRSSIDEDVPGKPKKGNKTLLIIGIVLGVALMTVLCSILLIIIMRLRKQLRALKQFQLELATKRVQPPLYSFQDLRNATRDFQEGNKLGSGASGIVYKGELKDGSTIAVKVLLYDEKQDTPELMDQFLNEVVLITGIKHKHLVQLQGCCIHGKKRMLVYEFAENGDVANALWGKRANSCLLSWEKRLNVCIGIARGLSYLHEKLQPLIIHRDIKAANILLDKYLSPKIGDFGLAKPFLEEDTHAQFTHIAGTRGYWATEYVLNGQLTQKADVYSFGILILEIVSGRPCIVTSLPEEQVSLKSWAEILPAEERPLQLLQHELKNACPEEEVRRGIDIALLCLQSNPKLRPTMSAVVFMLVERADVLHIVTTEDDHGDGYFDSVPFSPHERLRGGISRAISRIHFRMRILTKVH